MRCVRQLVFVCMIGCLFTSLIACGKNTKKDVKENVSTTEITTETLADKEEEVGGKIVVWVDSKALADSKYSEYKKEFEAKNPGTEVEFKVVPSYEAAGYQYIVNGNAGDVVMIPERMTEEEIKQYFIPFGTTEKIASKYREKYIHKLEYDGVIYGLPEYMMPQGIAYNKRVLEYAGIVELPKTPEDFLAMLKQIKSYDAGIVPFYVNVEEDGLEDWQLQVWGSVTGDPEYHYDGMVMETNPFSEGSPNYIVHKLLYDIVKDKACQQENIPYKRAKAMLNCGEIGCMLVNWKELSAIREAGTNPDDIGYMPFPYNIDGVQYATATYGYCYGIPLTSENKVTAEAFVDYMIKESGYANSVGAITLKKKVSKPTLLQDFTGVTMVVDAAPLEDKEGRYEDLCENSGILLDDVSSKMEVIRVAGGLYEGGEELEQESQEESQQEDVDQDDEMEVAPADFHELMKAWGDAWRTSK